MFFGALKLFPYFRDGGRYFRNSAQKVVVKLEHPAGVVLRRLGEDSRRPWNKKMRNIFLSLSAIFRRCQRRVDLDYINYNKRQVDTLRFRS
jgi:hypothetical protein